MIKFLDGKTVEIKEDITVFNIIHVAENNWENPIKVSKGSMGKLTGFEGLCCLADGTISQGLVVRLEEEHSRQILLPIDFLKFPKD